MSDRRKMGYWEPFNTWWREHVAKTDKRPNVHEMKSWYDANAARVWGGTGPTWEETKKHSKGMRRLEDIPDYFRKYRKGRKKKTDGGADDDSSESEGEPDSEGGATPPRRPGQRGRGGAAMQRSRAASTSQVPAPAPAPVTFFGLPVPGLPFLSNWRARSASTPTLHAHRYQDHEQEQEENDEAGGGPLALPGLPGLAGLPGLPFPINVSSGRAGMAAALPLATAVPHPRGQYAALPDANGGPKLPPLQQQHHSGDGDGGGGGGMGSGQPFPDGMVENAFGNFMASLSDAASEGGSDGGGAAAQELLAGAAAAAAAVAAAAGGDGGAGPSGMVPLDSALLMQVPSSALPPDMQVSEGRGMFGRLFTRNSTLKMVQSLFDRWATQDGGGDAEGSAGGGAAVGAAAAVTAGHRGAGPGPSAPGPYGQPHGPRHRSQGAPYDAPPQPYDPHRQQQQQQYQQLPQQQWGGPPLQGAVDGVGFVTMVAPGQQQQHGYMYPPGLAGAGGGTLLGKRGREEQPGNNTSPTHGAGAAGAPGRKLQRGLSGVFRPLLSMVSFGRRQQGQGGTNATNAVAAAAVAAAAAASGGSYPHHLGTGGGGGCDVGAPGGGVGAAAGDSSVGLGLLSGLGLDAVPSLMDGPGGLLSALDSKLFDGLPSLVGEGDALAALAVAMEASGGGAVVGGTGGDGGARAEVVKDEARVSAEVAAAAAAAQHYPHYNHHRDSNGHLSGMDSVSRESHLPTPFVVPEMQERVAPASAQQQQPSYKRPSANALMATAAGPVTGSPPAWQHPGSGAAAGGSRGHDSASQQTTAQHSNGSQQQHYLQQQHPQQQHPLQQRQQEYYPVPFIRHQQQQLQQQQLQQQQAGSSGWAQQQRVMPPPSQYGQQPQHTQQYDQLQPQMEYQQPQQQQQHPNQQHMIPEEHAQQQQPEGNFGGSLLFRLSSTMSDVFKLWGR